MTLDKAGVLVQSVQEAGGPFALELGDYRAVQGREVPALLRVTARGLSLEFRFEKPAARFD
ncbi:MAG: hypothetical protein KGL53_12515, partial [Elusimicrobia bacterium]|nr:hypothetical protein [Elusimicrobiota bacterium]